MLDKIETLLREVEYFMKLSDTKNIGNGIELFTKRGYLMRFKYTNINSEFKKIFSFSILAKCPLTRHKNVIEFIFSLENEIENIECDALLFQDELHKEYLYKFFDELTKKIHSIESSDPDDNPFKKLMEAEAVVQEKNEKLMNAQRELDLAKKVARELNIANPFDYVETIELNFS